MGFFSSDGKGSFTGPKKAEAPPLPDFKGLAAQQGQINKDTALFNAGLAHVNQSNPYGSITYGHTMDKNGNPITTMDTKLSGAQQTLFNANQANRLGLAQGRATGIGAVDNYMNQSRGNEMENWTGEDARKSMTDAVYARYKNQLDPRYEQEARQQENQLVQQGLTPGSDAYAQQMANFRRSRDSAYQDAGNQAVIQGDASQQQAFGQNLLKYQQTQNDYDTFMKNTSATLPTNQHTTSGGGAAAADFASAGQDQYNAQLQGVNAKNQQTQSAVGAAAGIAAAFF